MRARRAAVPAVLLALTLAPPALAAGLSASQAKLAASQAAQAIRIELHAARVSVTGCSRLGAGRFSCRAETHYTSGARRCTFAIVVAPAATKGGRPRTSPADFVCY